MTSLVFKWTLNCVALFCVMKIVPGIHIERFKTLLLATFVIGLLNTFLRPVIMMLTLPVNFMTLGLFTFVVNAMIFYLAAHLVPDFKVDSFSASFIASILFSFFSFVLSIFIKPSS